MHILSNISRSKGNQTIKFGNKTMKFGKLKEHNITNIFLEKNIHKVYWSNYSQNLF